MLSMEEEFYEARKEINELRASILNRRGDDLCWIQDVSKIPPKEEFLESCRRYHAQVAESHGVLEGCKTIAQLEADVTELKVALGESLKLQAHYGRLLNERDGGE